MATNAQWTLQPSRMSWNDGIWKYGPLILTCLVPISADLPAVAEAAAVEKVPSLHCSGCTTGQTDNFLTVIPLVIAFLRERLPGTNLATLNIVCYAVSMAADFRS